MIDIAKLIADIIEEDAITSAPTCDAGSADGIVEPNDGISTGDILGKDDDHHCSGFLSAKCNHIPKNILSTDVSKRKKKKTPYEVDMQILSEIFQNEQ